jgi:hypothetical protein
MDELRPPLIGQPITSVDQSTAKYFREHIGRVVGFLIVFAVVEIGAVAGFILNGAASNSAGDNGNGIYGIFIILPLVALAVAYSNMAGILARLMAHSSILDMIRR